MPASKNPPKILVAEDDEILRKCFKEMLESRGCEVSLADDGVAAVLSVMDMAPDYFDFILTDHLMPRLNGFDAIKIIKRLSPRVPVAIMTGHPVFLKDLEARVKAGEGVWCVEKPMGMDTLLQLIELAMQTSGKEV